MGGGGPLATLIEQWDGSSWRIVASPGSGYLNSVAAVSSRDVWAVGNAVSGQGVESQVTTLVEHWNGTQWSVVPTSNETASSLTSVAALDANTVWAVGAYSPTAGGSLPLFERWDGTVWRVVAGPALPGVTESILNAVARIPGTNQLWAVGYTLKGPRPAYEQPLIERWDGTVWRVIAGPALPDGAFGVKLHGVVALSATNAWAVGEYTASDHTIRLFIAQWDGATWRSVSIPEAANIAHSALLSVAATGAHDVRAGGYYFSDVNSNSVSQALVMRWNGAAWDVVTLPAPEGVDYTAIGAMTTDGAGGFWAAGNYLHPDTGSTSTLIERCG